MDAGCNLLTPKDVRPGLARMDTMEVGLGNRCYSTTLVNVVFLWCGWDKTISETDRRVKVTEFTHGKQLVSERSRRSAKIQTWLKPALKVTTQCAMNALPSSPC